MSAEYTEYTQNVLDITNKEKMGRIRKHWDQFQGAFAKLIEQIEIARGLPGILMTESMERIAALYPLASIPEAGFPSAGETFGDTKLSATRSDGSTSTSVPSQLVEIVFPFPRTS